MCDALHAPIPATNPIRPSFAQDTIETHIRRKRKKGREGGRCGARDGGRVERERKRRSESRCRSEGEKRN